ncbi:hypothetical protein ACFXG4_24225 [Nocardia sp. NPDC059246]|uniref:hypothetical protein n=1 Tax=unclassified Nocardia TaxID=2637762 RepID=UPI003685881A
MDDEFYDRVDQITMAESIAVGHIPAIAVLEFALGVVLDDGDPDDSERPLPCVSIALQLGAETVERAIVDAATTLLPAVTSEGLRPCALAVDVAGPIINGEQIACVLIMNMRGLIEGLPSASKRATGASRTNAKPFPQNSSKAYAPRSRCCKSMGRVGSDLSIAATSEA